MRLKGSCHCQAVKFKLSSKHPYPFNICYCSICRKTAGSAGSAINLAGDFSSLTIEGAENLSVYQARQMNKKTKEVTLSPLKRHFCKICGSQLWCWDPRWPELVHPHASAIDTDLPKPPEHTHLMLESKAKWVPVHKSENDQLFDEYPEESIAEWHERLSLTSQT